MLFIFRAVLEQYANYEAVITMRRTDHGETASNTRVILWSILNANHRNTPAEFSV